MLWERLEEYENYEFNKKSGRSRKSEGKAISKLYNH